MFIRWDRQTASPKSHAYSARRRRKARRQRSCRPRLEPLELRLAPATHFWTGEGSPGQQHLWSNSDNWDNDSPGGDPDAVLDYPSDVYLYNGSSSDDYPGEIPIRSIVFHRGSYFVGNASGSSAELIDNVGALYDDGTTNLNLDMRLTAAAHVFKVDGGSLELSGKLTGGGVILKQGGGTLTFDGDAGSYQGVIAVRAPCSSGPGLATPLTWVSSTAPFLRSPPTPPSSRSMAYSRGNPAARKSGTADQRLVSVDWLSSASASAWKLFSSSTCAAVRLV
jgi:hypothetical protein